MFNIIKTLQHYFRCKLLPRQSQQ